MFAKILCTERFMGFESNYIKICIARKHFKILHSEMCTAESENQIVFKKCIEICGFSKNLYPKFEFFSFQALLQNTYEVPKQSKSCSRPLGRYAFRRPPRSPRLERLMRDLKIIPSLKKVSIDSFLLCSRLVVFDSFHVFR